MEYIASSPDNHSMNAMDTERVLDYLTPQYWLELLQQPILWLQVLVLLLSLLGAWLLGRQLRRYLQQGEPIAGQRLRRFTVSSVRRMLFPVVMLLLVLVGRSILEGLGYQTLILNVAVPLLLSLAAIRLLVYGLRKAYPDSPTLKAWEGIISSSIWILFALHLLDWLKPIMAGMDALALRIGETRISLLSTLELLLLVGVLMGVAFWISSALERRMRNSIHVTPALQVALAKFIKFFLLTLAFLLALNAVGIDLTTLTVFGGALGVGIGFGLQRIASNFISGFILVLDRSIRPGDVISIGGKMGWVEALRARYVVVRSRDGVETLVPNENLVTSEVINWSYSDPNVRVKIPVSISYHDDPEQAMAIMMQIAQANERVLAEPAPSVRLMEFGDSGIHLEMRVWVNDPEEGLGSVRSAINLAIWRAFKEAGITIPFPQRDVHVRYTEPGQGDRLLSGE